MISQEQGIGESVAPYEFGKASGNHGWVLGSRPFNAFAHIIRIKKWNATNYK